MTKLLDRVTKRSALRVHVDGSWSAVDFRDFFAAIDILYVFFGLRKQDDHHPDVADELASSLSRDPDILQSTQDVVVNLLRSRTPKSFRIKAAELGHLKSKEDLRRWHALVNAQRLLTAAVLESCHRLQGLPEPDAAALGVEDGTAEFSMYVEAMTAYTYSVDPDPYVLPRYTVLPPPLRIRRIQYASPGLTDLAGVGQIVGHVKELLLELLKLKQARLLQAVQLRKLAAEAREIEARADELELKVLSARLDELRKLGFSATECIHYASRVDDGVARLSQLIERKQLTGVESADA